MHLRDVTALLISSHDAFSLAFSEAATAAVHLVVDPRNPDATDQRRCARKFISMSLLHMSDEEARAFPNAIACGVPRDVVDRLYADHRELRALAAALEPILAATELDDEGALALMRFIHRFEQHVQREEWSLATSC